MRVLVTAASKHGSTGEIATWIGQAMRDAGVVADVRDPDDITTLDGYDAVVLGSGVYAGRWLDPAKKLVERLGAELALRPVWLFSSGPVGDPLKPDDDPADVAVLVAATGARGHTVFAGKIDRKVLGLGERAIVAALRVPDGDFRRPDVAQRWATEVATTLVAEATPV